jgi:hypothetical protein
LIGPSHHLQLSIIPTLMAYELLHFLFLLSWPSRICSCSRAIADVPANKLASFRRVFRREMPLAINVLSN